MNDSELKLFPYLESGVIPEPGDVILNIGTMEMLGNTFHFGRQYRFFSSVENGNQDILKLDKLVTPISLALLREEDGSRLTKPIIFNPLSMSYYNLVYGTHKRFSGQVQNIVARLMPTDLSFVSNTENVNVNNALTFSVEGDMVEGDKLLGNSLMLVSLYSRFRRHGTSQVKPYVHVATKKVTSEEVNKSLEEDFNMETSLALRLLRHSLRYPLHAGSPGLVQQNLKFKPRK